nr:MAG TPA: hypothetical protein [Caudoviricetes sp.]
MFPSLRVSVVIFIIVSFLFKANIMIYNVLFTE